MHSLGPITLFDKTGHAVVGGSIAAPLNSEIAEARGSGPAPSAYRDAVELNMWTPRDGTDPSQWNGGPLRSGTPDQIAANKKSADLATTNISDWSLARDIPLCNGPSTGSYANRYELRLVGIQNGPVFSPQYYTATIVVDPKAGTWRLANAASPATSSGIPMGPVGGGVAAVVLLGAVSGIALRRRRRAAALVGPTELSLSS